MKPTLIAQLDQQTRELNTLESLRWISEAYGSDVAFSLGFGKEGMVIADMIFRHHIPIRVFTIDTGRLFKETQELFYQVAARYKQPIELYFPNGQEVEFMVNTKGPMSFYDSLENRKECCNIRKVRPLKRALAGSKVWVTGLRADQSDFRKNFRRFEWHEGHQLVKFNPLLSWTKEEVDAYLKAHQVPYNRLHDKGFPSIGCAPCTRAVQAGEDERAGRWWWEQSQKECGLHASYFQPTEQQAPTSTAVTLTSACKRKCG
ncbi:MAG: phosphoadenylyl-sulfate reductase [Bacteroidota bacterium]